MNRQQLLFPVNLQFFNSEKTEKATPKKRSDARQKGQVAKTPELTPAITLTAVFLMLMVFGSYMYDIFQKIMRQSLITYTHWEVNQENLSVITNQLLFQSIKIVGPILGVIIVVVFASNYLQIGWLFTTETLKMKLDKLNPITGAKRLFSMQSVITLIKSLLKISAGLLVAYSVLHSAIDKIVILSLTSIEEAIKFACDEALKVGLYLGALLILLSAFDYAYQRYSHEKSLRMSKQDIKDEHKNSEGDPLIKGKIRERQRMMAMRRMMQELPNADVIITNPTHFAVAIKYESSTMTAPTVIAKGQDFMALKIREIAKKHRIVTMENKPLARALYSQVEIGQQIPEELFKAVAEVLAYVYKIQGKAK